MRQNLLNDPLYEITERYLSKASTESLPSEKVIDCVVTDYMRLLYLQGVNIPQSVKSLFITDIKEEVREILVKLTCSSIEVTITETQKSESLFRKIS
ncbi:MAG: hypothetical protein IPM57_08440 [Oligoflexia bacterium]|nr:hypothetical protein [Oligoflexia bacterium]